DRPSFHDSQGPKVPRALQASGHICVETGLTFRRPRWYEYSRAFKLAYPPVRAPGNVQVFTAQLVLASNGNMSQHSEIEWPDATWNPVRGCPKISPGCAHCYAETFAERFRGVPGHPYEQGFDLRLVPEKLPEPLRWKTPKMIFVNSMSDLFHEEVPSG